MKPSLQRAMKAPGTEANPEVKQGIWLSISTINAVPCLSALLRTQLTEDPNVGNHSVTLTGLLEESSLYIIMYFCTVLIP